MAVNFLSPPPLLLHQSYSPPDTGSNFITSNPTLIIAPAVIALLLLIDPAVLASLPPSLQLDLLVQMRERTMAENRKKYQKFKKSPAKFSELQILSYLKTVAFRSEIDEVQRCASGRGLGGVQTSKIASESNREFIFSSSFTGDKQMLAQQVGSNGNTDGNIEKKYTPSDSILNAATTSRSATKAPINELETNLSSEIETYKDERKRVRVSRFRGLGIRMTRDIQRNLDFIKEYEQESNMGGRFWSHKSYGRTK